MALSSDTIRLVEDIIRKDLSWVITVTYGKTDFLSYAYRFLGKDKMAIYAFMRDIDQKLLLPIFKDIAIVVARSRYQKVLTKVVIGDRMKGKAQDVILEIMKEIWITREYGMKSTQVERIRFACRSEAVRIVKVAPVDLFFIDKEGYGICCLITHDKQGPFTQEKYKRRLLNWCGVSMTKNPDARVKTIIAIPYYFYAHQPYRYIDLAVNFDREDELKVGADFWDFLGGEGTYSDLLDCFERVGIELRPEIDAYFQRFHSL